MGVFQRIAESFTVRAHRVLDRFDEPAAAFDRARGLQSGLLAEARERLERLADEEKELRTETQKEQRSADRWERAARQRLAEGGEEAARAALVERAGALSRIEQLTRRGEALRAERDNINDLIPRLEDRLAEFGALAETVRAADAAARADEAMAAIDAEADELRRMADDTARRAEPPDLDAELAAVETEALVNAQLRWLKDDLRRNRRSPGSGGPSRSAPR